MRLRQRLADESGVTLMEMLVGMIVGIVVLGGIVTMMTTTSRSSGRITERVVVNQQARPMMQRIMDALHSTCVAPAIAPIRPGSTGSDLWFIHKTGSEVSPDPELRRVTLSGDDLTMRTYELITGAPNWLYNDAPSSTFRLLTGVESASLGSPPSMVPAFRYRAYENGVIDTDPLPVPLSSSDAARTVMVDVAFAVRPSQSQTSDEDAAPVVLSSSALLRFSPSNEDTSKAGLPCT
jgi:hypothetical protein